MKRLIPLRDKAHLRLALPSNEGWINKQLWIPVSYTELHLASNYFPVVVRLDDGKPSLGLVLGDSYLKRPVVDASGKWQGGYKPIALRCFPFQAGEIGEDPLSDILIDSAYDRLTDRDGIPLIDDAGKPSSLILEIHRLFRLLQDSRAKFSEALDLLLIGNLLSPLKDAGRDSATGDRPPLYIVDHTRFMQTRNMAFGALGRRTFTALDVSVACLTSQRLLQTQYLPKPTSLAKLQSATSLPKDSFAIEDFDLVLDDDELISFTDIDVLRPEVR
jgi:SapC